MTKNEDQIMISLVTLPLRDRVVVKVVSQILILQAPSQIFLVRIFSKIFLMDSVALEVEDEENLQILEEPTLDTIYLFL